MPNNRFEECIFINCPLDEDYEPILQAILFCTVYLGFSPRYSRERNDAAENRLDKIQELIEGSKYSIHDLSRCRAKKKGEYFRLNMPLELGIDYGCRKYFGRGRDKKKFLILEEQKYQNQRALSDLNGCDFEAHKGDYELAMKKVRNWLVGEARIVGADGPSRIMGAYVEFQEWHYKRQQAAGFSEEDIQDYPTNELLDAMREWRAGGRPA